ncbi:MAG: acetamidase [Rhodospirillales bacterium]|nr:acetamidase [Rhodospirillales bacterium]
MRHTIHKKHHHYGWDNSLTPVMTVAPGDVVEFETFDASGGQITANTKPQDLHHLDWSKANPTTGPVYIDGAMPGDAIKVSMLDYTLSGQGFTAVIPGFGLLADDFKDPAIQFWKYATDGKSPAAYGPGGRVPLKPFVGTIGLAPAEAGRHSVVPPRRVGGNMDFRDLGAGSELYLPVEVKGGLFSLGDSHAAQGDGEVCGSALESRLDVTVKFELIKGGAPRFPRMVTTGPVTRHLDAKGYEVTTGIGPDLMEGAKNAVRGMIDVLTAQHGMSPEDAYMLCSVCADLRISEIVDKPNWVVSMYFPRIVFD